MRVIKYVQLQQAKPSLRVFTGYRRRRNGLMIANLDDFTASKKLSTQYSESILTQRQVTCIFKSILGIDSFTMLTKKLLVPGLLAATARAVTVTQTPTAYTFSNSLITFDLLKSNGYIQNFIYQNTSLLGPPNATASTGYAYSDFPSYTYALGNTSFNLLNGSNWAGIVITDDDASTGHLIQRSWFLKDGESGLHSFLRLAYYNDTATNLGPIGEIRSMFRPTYPEAPWTDIITNNAQWAPLPSDAATAAEIQVQDATWYLGNTPSDPYVIAESDYFTKYTFADNQTNNAHGLYFEANGTGYGVWWVINQKDTLYNGPFHVDLMVDGITYDKLTTSHGGAHSPNVSNGFDRTFGPHFLYLNTGNSGIQGLLADAESYADPAWNSEFYDEISPYIVGYAPSWERGTFEATVSIPEGASEVVAILSANGTHFQDSSTIPSAYQYFQTDVKDGKVGFSRVKEGTYRLTIVGVGIFGDYVQDGLVVEAGKTTTFKGTWVPESAGKELWRIGVPDKTAGEYKNGYERDLTHPNQPAKYRIYWGAWDFPTQFPNGVNYTIGESNELDDWNYIHWSQFGPSYTDNSTYNQYNNWYINFELDQAPSANSTATFTVQLAGARTTAGNTGEATGKDPSFNISTYVNGQSNLLNWIIEPYQSSSCGERSAISCYLIVGKFPFPGSWLKQGWNQFNISLPYAQPVYIQYDALRLELN